MKGVLTRFIDFLKIEYPQYSTYIKPEQITKRHGVSFRRILAE